MGKSAESHGALSGKRIVKDWHDYARHIKNYDLKTIQGHEGDA